MLSHTLLLAVLVAPAQSVHPPWAPGVAYNVRDLVSYLGVEYVCWQAHTSRAGLEPPAAPSLWRVFSGRETAVPAVPLGLAAVAVGPARIVVTWSLVPGATGYDLLVDGTVVGGAASPYQHKGLTPGSAHAYRVRAVNEGVSSAWSEAVTCSTERATSGK
ncbi:carbohydrate-binding protein [Geothrix sp. 21YS21S-2]|uniref:carbohydrate-binding protein n=1 Tax=Geothrix sp. 21YS21S-2 TaxID=3068893 RepID=UPI0027B923AB|nr:carbohydrate-binding protein [Geothrix sp. 21YS21S-2]